MRRLQWLALGLVLLFNIVLSVANEDSTLAQPPSDAAADAEAEVGNADLDDYVTAYGVTPEEARQQWEATDLAGELQAELVKTEGDIFGGLWIECEPTFAIVVGVLAGSEETAQAHIDRIGLAEEAHIQQVQHTLEQLQADQAAVSAAADAAGIDVAAGVDQAEGRVTAFVRTAEAASRLTRLQLPETVDVVQQAFPGPQSTSMEDCRSAQSAIPDSASRRRAALARE